MGNLFSQGGKTIWTNLSEKKTFPVDGQTSWAKLFSQLINLPGARPLKKPLETCLEDNLSDEFYDLV